MVGIPCFFSFIPSMGYDFMFGYINIFFTDNVIVALLT